MNTKKQIDWRTVSTPIKKVAYNPVRELIAGMDEKKEQHRVLHARINRSKRDLAKE